MIFYQENKVVQLCAKGIEFEGQGKISEASTLFNNAWNIAADDLEKFTAAHYVARHQRNAYDKLNWDQIALQHALNIDDEAIKETLPSLYLNIGKCYEDLHHFEHAKEHYQLAFSFTSFLPDDGYGKMIKTGISNGLARVM
jgi:tetratricopeptide (TPR) repeat protein